MASQSIESATLVFSEFENITPRPLRITKPTKTLTRRQEARSVGHARGLRINEDSESPPQHKCRPIAMQKLRCSRGSLLDFSAEHMHPESKIFDVRQEAMSTTQLSEENLRAMLRFNNAHNTLPQSSTMQTIINTAPSNWNSNAENGIAHVCTKQTSGKTSIPTHRTLSKGRRMVDKVFQRMVSSRSIESNRISEDELDNARARLSLQETRQSSSTTSYVSNRLSLDSSVNTATNLSTSAHSHDMHDPSAILYPEISIIPREKTTTASDGCSLWAAIVVKGVLVSGPPPSPEQQTSSSASSRQSSSEWIHSHDARQHGYLHNVKVKISAGPSWILAELIKPEHETKILKNCQSMLYIVKVTCRPDLHGLRARESSADLMEDLEKQLGTSVTEYVHVRVTYRHSFHPHTKSLATPSGMSYYVTTSFVEARATIPTMPLDVVWSPRSALFGDTGDECVWNAIIQEHYNPEQTSKTLRHISTSRARAHRPFIRRHSSRESEQCETPLTSEHLNPTPDISESSTPSTYDTAILDIQTPTKPIYHTRKDVESEESMASQGDPTDPAKVIWREMRRISSGTPRYTLDKQRAHAKIPSTIRSSDQGDSEYEQFEEDKVQLKQIALRNKRSIGAESLQSIMPNSGMGLGPGRFFAFGG